jgi:hypothetical protein
VLARDADALLRVDRALVVARAGAQEHVLELVHPGVREEQRRVVLGEHRRRGHDAVPARSEEVEEVLAHARRGEALGAVHRGGELIAKGGSDAQRRAPLRALGAVGPAAPSASSVAPSSAGPG